MATTNVTKVHCDRCKRVEEKPVLDIFSSVNPVAGGGLMPTVNPQPVAQTIMVGAPVYAFEATLLVDSTHDDGERKNHKAAQFKFQDLCGPCQRTVHALLLQIAKKIDGLSPDRKESVARKKSEATSSSKVASSSSHSAAASSVASKRVETGTRSS